MREIMISKFICNSYRELFNAERPYVGELGCIMVNSIKVEGMLDVLLE